METATQDLATQLTRLAETVVDELSGIDDATWQTIVPNEDQTVAALVHHMADTLQRITSLLEQVAAGGAVPELSMELIHRANEQNKRENAHCPRPETLALLQANAARMDAFIRARTPGQLQQTVSVALFEHQPVTVQGFVERTLLGHIAGHLQSIRTITQADLRGVSA